MEKKEQTNEQTKQNKQTNQTTKHKTKQNTKQTKQSSEAHQPKTINQERAQAQGRSTREAGRERHNPTSKARTERASDASERGKQASNATRHTLKYKNTVGLTFYDDVL